jgi:uncharacterized membrane protein
MKELGLLWVWCMMGVLVIAYIVALIREQSFNSGYWKGRKAGWDSHRRITNIKAKSDEVFDYEKQN